MNVRELMKILVECDPEAEVMTSTSRELQDNPTCSLHFPTRDAEPGTFPDVEANSPKHIGALDFRGKKFLMICSTDAWGISPRKR